MGNIKSLAIGKSNSAAKVQQVSSMPNNLQGRMSVRMVQNTLLIWLDSNINKNKNDSKNTISQLQLTVNNVNTFTDRDQCIKFLESIEEEKACMIISGSLGQRIVPSIHGMSQVDSIFIFCQDKKFHEEWASNWPKIRGVFTNILQICEALKQAAHRCEHNAISISFMSINDDSNKNNSDEFDISFMYAQILKEAVLAIDFEPKHFQDFITYCRQEFAQNEKKLLQIKQIERKYRDQTPVWWYTRDLFLYPMLNRALRTIDVDVIVRMGFFIKDSHRYIQQLHTKQVTNGDFRKPFTVYRSQALSKTIFDQLIQTKGGLIVFNNFLSTSKSRNGTLNFARTCLNNPNVVGVLFAMTIDPTQSSTPFASTTETSYNGDQEDEILFSMHTLFRIQEIKQMGENNRLYQIDLSLINDHDKDLRMFNKNIQEEISGIGWFRLGELLLQMDQTDKAEEVYRISLEYTTDESKSADIYHQLGTIKGQQEKHQEAIEFYRKSLQIKQKTLPSHHLSLASSYNNIALVYHSIGDYSNALSNHMNALKIRKRSLPANHPDLSASYKNIDSVYDSMGKSLKPSADQTKVLEI